MSKQYLQTHTNPTAHPTDIFALATTPSHLLSASGSSSILIHRTTNPPTTDPSDPSEDNPYPLIQTLHNAHPLGCHHLATSLDGSIAASAGFGGEVKLWRCDAEGTWSHSHNLAQAASNKTSPAPWALALSPTGDLLACTTHSGHINLYPTTTTTAETPQTPTTSFETQGSLGLSVDISPDGALTASGHANGSVYIFNNRTQTLAHSLSSLLKPVRTVRFSPGGTLLAAAGDAGIIALYSVTSGQQVASLAPPAAGAIAGREKKTTGAAGGWVMSVDYSASGEWLVSGAFDGKVRVWGVGSGQCVAVLAGPEEECVWGVKWAGGTPGQKGGEVFITGGRGGLGFYREAGRS